MKINSSNEKMFNIINKRTFSPSEKEIPTFWRNKIGNSGKIIFMDQLVLQNIMHHARTQSPYECFGLLLGNAYFDKHLNTKWIVVTESLPAQKTKSSPASVEVSAREFNKLNKAVDTAMEETADLRKIGWYHSHPNMSIFMSGTDKNNQRLFYNKDWQVALVVDPVKDKHGFFSGENCDKTDYAIVDASVVYEFYAIPRNGVLGGNKETIATQELEPTRERISAIPGRKFRKEPFYTIGDKEVINYGYIGIATLALALSFSPFLTNQILGKLGYPIIAAVAGLFAKKHLRYLSKIEQVQKELFTLFRNEKLELDIEAKRQVLNIILEINSFTQYGQRARRILDEIEASN